MLENRSLGFQTRSDKSQAVQPYKMARGLKFRIWGVEGLHYLCSENKGADQLCGYRKADLSLCFRICKNTVFSRRGSFDNGKILDLFVFFTITYVVGNICAKSVKLSLNSFLNK